MRLGKWASIQLGRENLAQQKTESSTDRHLVDSPLDEGLTRIDRSTKSP